MHARNKSIFSGFIGGIVYAALMAGFDYFDGEDFRLWRFLFAFLFFGTFMGFMTRYNLKKQAKKKNK